MEKMMKKKSISKKILRKMSLNKSKHSNNKKINKTVKAYNKISNNNRKIRFNNPMNSKIIEMFVLYIYR